MEDDWLDLISDDFKSLPEVKIKEDSKAREHVMRVLAVLFLKIWMRFALDTGRKMIMAPSSDELGLYTGKNNWTLSGGFNFAALSELAITDKLPREHSLRVEAYTVQGREHIRVAFSLEEERVLGQSVLVTYVIYSALAKDFSIDEMIKNLKPGLGKWYMALASGELSILWNYCRDKYELVGV